VTRSWDESDFARDPVIGINEVDKARVNHGGNSVGKVPGVPAGLGHPRLVFGTTEQIASVRKCRHPLAVFEFRIPTHVIEVQVRATHNVDGLGREPCRRQALQKCGIPCKARKASHISIADTGVNDDAQSTAFDHKRVDRKISHAFIVDEIWHEPCLVRGKRFLGRPRKQPA
jgi:hypothetical protein